MKWNRDVSDFFWIEPVTDIKIQDLMTIMIFIIHPFYLLPTIFILCLSAAGHFLLILMNFMNLYLCFQAPNPFNMTARNFPKRKLVYLFCL